MGAVTIRGHAGLSPTRVVLLTSGDHTGDLARLAGLAIGGRLLKPVSQDDLLETIDRVMSQPVGEPPPALEGTAPYCRPRRRLRHRWTSCWPRTTSSTCGTWSGSSCDRAAGYGWPATAGSAGTARDRRRAGRGPRSQCPVPGVRPATPGRAHARPGRLPGRAGGPGAERASRADTCPSSP